tara:strand:- start:4179 stop:4652 length:474 start_codon:yes stop_codon:yes gene_type:complete
MYRIGNGYDVHRLVEGRKLILGGVEVKHTLGLDGNSDADVLCHALCDAILGACGKADIGHYFPDTNAQWKGISSLVLLERVGEICSKQGYHLGNADTILVAQRPRLAPYLEQMKFNLSKALAVDSSTINIKVTTTEQLGFVGREEGISAYAIVLLQK